MNKVLKIINTKNGKLVAGIMDFGEDNTSYCIEYWECGECLCSETMDTELEMNARIEELLKE